MKYCKAHSLRHYCGSRLLYTGVPENDVADWMGHSSTDVLREHYRYIFEGAEQRGRAAIATMLTPGGDDPRRRQRSPDPRTATAPGSTPGAVLFVQVSGRSQPGIHPGFPQHDAQERSWSGRNGQKAEGAPPDLRNSF
ncbi:tyrosine-type recombinase/integrase [Streptomyces sp. SID8016]|uniref:tyrosine-type recombinase/integrase n=1 Tax=Streptomyces sp. SID8016 TaxID=2706098 RepID=UPI0031B9E604